MYLGRIPGQGKNQESTQGNNQKSSQGNNWELTQGVHQEKVISAWRKRRHMLTPESPPESAQGNNKESAKGKSQESGHMNNQESAACYSITATYNLSSFHSVAITW